jgi:hypothetical protein
LVSLRSFTHVALRVERLREAEAFYRELVALEVAFREAETAKGWRTLPARAAWEDAEAAGGGILGIAGVLIMFIWSLLLGLIVALIGLVGFGGFVRGKWY